MPDFTAWLETLKGYRTFIVQGVLAVVSLLVAFHVIDAAQAAGVTSDAVASNVDAVIGGLGVLISAIAMIMRLFTSTPAGQAVHPAAVELANQLNQPGAAG